MHVSMLSCRRCAAAVLVMWLALSSGGCDGSEGGEPDAQAGTGGSGGGGSGGASGSHAGDSGAHDGGGTRADSGGGDADGSMQERDSGEEDAGELPAPTFPPDEDADGDGLDNGTELELGTDPRYRDTDLDGLADDAEVGADSSAALDADDDGVIDALEHPRFDNDRDDATDDTDAADGVQVVYGRFMPAVLANDGRDAVRFELKLSGEVERASIGMSPTYYRAEWAPDELAIDGEALDDEAIELFDDGTHGDVIAGDQVYTRGGITTEMAIRGELERFNGQRCRVLFNELSLTTSNGPETVPLGTTDGVMPRLIPDFGFWLPVLDAALAPAPQAIASVGQRASHVLNVVDAELAVTLTRFLMEYGSDEPATIAERRDLSYAFSARAFGPFDADADFVYMFASHAVYSPIAGFYFGLANDVGGIGRAIQAIAPQSGSAGRLRGVLSFGLAIDFPLNHEVMHSWGVELEPLLGTGEGHWGTAGTFGVLGGFDPASLVDQGGGTFLVDHFSEAGNDWNTTRFSPIELYLMGLIPPADVAPIPVLADIEVLANDADGLELRATRTTVTIDDIVATHGARTPASADARKDFAALFVIFSDRDLSAAELGLINHIAAAYEEPSVAYGISFADATGGRGTMTTELPAVAP
jgi:hypothetical protein